MKDKKIKVEDLRIGQIVFCVEDLYVFAVKIQGIRKNGNSYRIEGIGGYSDIGNVFISKEDAIGTYLSNVNKHTIDSVKYLEERIKDFSKESEESEVSNE